MKKPKIVFMHKETGDIKICRTELEGQLLGKEWTRIQFTKNEKGERVMRVNFGSFTMDVLPNGVQEVVDNGNQGSK